MTENELNDLMNRLKDRLVDRLSSMHNQDSGKRDLVSFLEKVIEVVKNDNQKESFMFCVFLGDDLMQWVGGKCSIHHKMIASFMIEKGLNYFKNVTYKELDESMHKDRAEIYRCEGPESDD